MTEQQMPWQMRRTVAEKLASMPEVDFNGWDAAAPTEQPAAETPVGAGDAAPVLAPTGPQPDPSQGYQGAPPPPDDSNDPLAAVRRQAARHYQR